METIRVFRNAYDQSGYSALMERFGPVVKKALSDDSVEEIMLNCDGTIFVDELKKGMHPVGVLSRDEAESVLRTLASLMDKELNRSCPILSGEIPYNGSRFEGLLPPLVRAPIFSIRRHCSLDLDLEAMISARMLTDDSAILLQQAVLQKRNIIISGGTGSGKTTLINALINNIEPNERLITIEDTLELHVGLKNHISLCTSDTVDMSTLLRSALRLRPDRIIVGEVRGPEALDLVDALSTGHRGGMASVHAGSIEQALQRLVLLISRHRAAPRLIEPTLASALDLMVHVTRYPVRHVTAISQVMGYSDGHFKVNPIYNHTTSDTRFRELVRGA